MKDRFPYFSDAYFIYNFAFVKLFNPVKSAGKILQTIYVKNGQTDYSDFYNQFFLMNSGHLI